jgi:hypothetical protein
MVVNLLQSATSPQDVIKSYTLRLKVIKTFGKINVINISATPSCVRLSVVSQAI